MAKTQDFYFCQSVGQYAGPVPRPQLLQAGPRGPGPQGVAGGDGQEVSKLGGGCNLILVTLKMKRTFFATSLIIINKKLSTLCK